MNDNFEYNNVPYSTSSKFAIYPLSDRGIGQYTKDSLIQKKNIINENKRLHEFFENDKKSNLLQEINSSKTVNSIDDQRNENKFQTDYKEIKLPIREKVTNFNDLNDARKRTETNTEYLFI